MSGSFRVLFVSGQDGGTRYCRCYHPQEQLATQGVETGFRESSDPRMLADALDYDVFVLHRVPYSDLSGRLLDLIRGRGKLAIFETDDLVFEPDMVPYDGLYRSLAPAEKLKYEIKVRDHLKLLGACDVALTTTEYLAEVLRGRGKQTYVSRNALGVEFMRLAREAGPPKFDQPASTERVVIGYVSGSTTHDQDFETATDALCQVMAAHPQVELHVIGPLNLNPRFEAFGPRVKTTPLIPFQEVPQASWLIDINLAPLEIDNPFCQSKSELKYIEGGMLGQPTIASRTDAFEHAIRHGENGLLVNDTQEWVDNLELLITDPERRRAIGRAAYQDVLQKYAPEVRGRQFVALLSDVLAQHRPDPALILPEEQIERRVIDHLLETLEQAGTSFDLFPQPPVQSETGAQPPAHLAQRLEEALAAVRQARRQPLARWGAGLKQALKRLLRRTYRLSLDDRAYQLLDELLDGQVYGQVIQATEPNLCQVAVLFATFGRVNTPDLVFRLKFSPSSTEDLVLQTVSASALYDGQFYAFTFDPLPDSAGKSYYFSLESPDAIRGDAVGVWSLAGAAEAGGGMYQDGRPVPGELAHKVRYA